MYTHSRQNKHGCKLVLEAAHHHIVSISEHYNFMLIGHTASVPNVKRITSAAPTDNLLAVFLGGGGSTARCSRTPFTISALHLDPQWSAAHAALLLTAWQWPRLSSTPCCEMAQHKTSTRDHGHLPSISCPRRARDGGQMAAVWRLQSPKCTHYP